jgi:hypothetical protein
MTVRDPQWRDLLNPAILMALLPKAVTITCSESSMHHSFRGVGDANSFKNARRAVANGQASALPSVVVTFPRVAVTQETCCARKAYEKARTTCAEWPAGETRCTRGRPRVNKAQTDGRSASKDGGKLPSHEMGGIASKNPDRENRHGARPPPRQPRYLVAPGPRARHSPRSGRGMRAPCQRRAQCKSR